MYLEGSIVKKSRMYLEGSIYISLKLLVKGLKCIVKKSKYSN